MRNALDWLLASEDSEAPYAITDLSIALSQSPDDLVLTWSVPYDNVGVTFYRVYRDVSAYFSPGPSVLLAITASTTWTDVGAAGDPASNLFYIVTAIDGADNESPPSNRVGEQDFDAQPSP
jgi:hypothetical protein